MYALIYTKAAAKDAKKLKESPLYSKAKALLAIIALNPYQTPPPYEKLIGDFAGYYSRRINIQHRLVYSVNETDKTIKVILMWEHYE